MNQHSRTEDAAIAAGALVRSTVIPIDDDAMLVSKLFLQLPVNFVSEIG